MFARLDLVLPKTCCCDLEHVAVTPARVDPRSGAHASDRFDGTLRSNISNTDNEDDPVDELEGMLKHEPLHLAVVSATPMRPREKRPTDLHFAPAFVEGVEPRRTDDAARGSVDGNQSAPRVHRLLKETAEPLGLAAVFHRVLLPDERIRGHSKERVEIVRSKRSQFDEFTFQSGLKIERTCQQFSA
jgi:hypothetical protein